MAENGIPTTIRIGGEVFERIRYGSEQDDWRADESLAMIAALRKARSTSSAATLSDTLAVEAGALLRLSIRRLIDARGTTTKSPRSLILRSTFHDNAHSIGLDDGDWGSRGDEFAFGDDIDNVISKTRLAARSQDGHSSAMRSRRQRECSRELSRYSGQRRARWI